jgi:hypothetical protein
MKVKDKVKTHLSLWKGEIGTIKGMIEIALGSCYIS